METLRRTFWVVTAMCLFMTGMAFAQEMGDYRSAATGNWSAAATWETFDGANWVTATTAPTGAETITVRNQDSVRVDVPTTITGYVAVVDTGVVEVTTGSLEFGDGSTYEHGRDAGNVPTATWGVGSTFLITGTEGDAPENRNQSYYNITLNTPNMNSNNDLGLDDVTISGSLRVIESGARWRLTSASPQDTAIVTIMGDVIVEGGAFETQGTSNALTAFIVHHFGNIDVTGATFGISRGSQGDGSGTTTWTLYEGNISMTDAEIRNSNPTEGQAKFVFARGDTQQIVFNNVEFGGGDIHYEVSDSTTLELPQPFVVNGRLTNMGEVVARDSLTFIEGGIYEHARDGGSVPSAFWEEGSEVRFTGIVSDAPDNRGQDYYNLTLNTPGLLSNEDLSLDGNTISGDITVISSGDTGNRWRLVGGSSGTVTIMGDVIVQGGSLETLGTSSETIVEVLHHGNVNVTGGTFAVSRGSQGGVGTTTWYLLAGDFSISDATTRNSNPDGATFVFASENGTQNITLVNVDYGSGGLPIRVDSTTTLNADTSTIGGEGDFVLSAGATLATAHVNGVEGTLQTSGDIMLSTDAGFTFNGTEAQVTSTLMPTTVTNLTIDNAAGVALSQETTINGVLRLVAGIFDNTIPFTLGVEGTISFEGGDLLIPVSVEETPGIPTEFALRQNYPNPFNPSTTISYALPQRSHVTLKIYDVLGREVATLIDDDYEAGAHEVVWDASGQTSGVYFYRISAGDFTSVRKLLLMK